MKKLIALILFPFLVIPFGAKANDNFSVEIEALTLVMEQYKKVTESSKQLDFEDKKPSYMALKQDECNATVEVTEKTGLEVVNTEYFDVNVCLKEIYKVINWISKLYNENKQIKEVFYLKKERPRDLTESFGTGSAYLINNYNKIVEV